MKSKTLNMISLIGSVAIITIAVLGVVFTINGSMDGIVMTKYLSVCSGMLLALAAFFVGFFSIRSIVKGKCCTPAWVKGVKYTATTISLVVFFVSCAYLHQGWEAVMGGGFLYLRLIAPVLAALVFIFFDLEPAPVKYWVSFIPTLLIGIYGGLLIGLAAANVIDPLTQLPYDIMRVLPSWVVSGNANDWWINIICCAAIFVGSYLTAILLGSLNTLMYKLLIVEEPKPEPVKEEPKKEEPKPVAPTPIIINVNTTNNAPAAAPAVAPVKEEPKVKTVEKIIYVPKVVTKEKIVYRDRTIKVKAPAAPQDHPDFSKVYHVSMQDKEKKTWKVKLAGGKKVLSVFPTQAEAIEYAREQVRVNGGSIRVHSRNGKMRSDATARGAGYKKPL